MHIFFIFASKRIIVKIFISNFYTVSYNDVPSQQCINVAWINWNVHKTRGRWTCIAQLASISSIKNACYSIPLNLSNLSPILKGPFLLMWPPLWIVSNDSDVHPRWSSSTDIVFTNVHQRLGPPNDYSTQVWSKLPKQFQRKRKAFSQ